MSIRLKMILVVLPLLVVTLALAGISSYIVATGAVNRAIEELLAFKVSELEKYAESQWLLLVENDLTARPDMAAAAQRGVATFASSIIRSPTELIAAFDETGGTLMSTSTVELSPGEREAVGTLTAAPPNGLSTVTLGGVERIASGFLFAPFEWFVLVTEERDAFYADVDRITLQSVVILIAASLISVFLLLWFSRLLTNPLGRIITAMRGIITDTDLSSRVTVEYGDETGQLAHTFNIMIGELEKAYTQIKRYAFEAVLAQKKETKIRNIFQKYVPQELIERFFRSPESMLVGENRELAVLFSDIRGFTTISEGMSPDDLVSSLNRYFSGQVDIIMNRSGIVDKYIGDAIMAFFGAPVTHDDDALQAVLAGIEMSEAVEDFNRQQKELGKPEFHIGVGINYGIVTVGNIGTDKKMDYTVIGDMVNLASRLEGLTKAYHQPLLISEFLRDKVGDALPCRFLDTVAVKGKTKGVRIYTAKKELLPTEQAAWNLHNEAMQSYYARRFEEAAAGFRQVLELLPGDHVATEMLQRADGHAAAPPAASWEGVEVMTSK